MNVIPVNNDNKSSSYLKATALGGVTGYALKYVMPLQECEKKEVFGDFFNLKKQNAIRTARINEYKAINKVMQDGSESFSPDVVSFFKENKANIIKTGDNRKGLDEKLKLLPDAARSQVDELMERINIKGIERGEFLQESLLAYAKRSRPAFYYIAVGAAISLCFTTLKNYFSNKKYHPEGINIII